MHCIVDTLIVLYVDLMHCYVRTKFVMSKISVLINFCIYLLYVVSCTFFSGEDFPFCRKFNIFLNCLWIGRIIFAVCVLFAGDEFDA